jgi:hypothetical protein
MTIREKFKHRVIELIHGLPYEEAIKKEHQTSFVSEQMIKRETGYFENGKYWETHPITIGRIMYAISINNIAIDCKGNFITYVDDNNIETRNFLKTDINWKLAREDKAETTDDDQTDETIEALYKLIK